MNFNLAICNMYIITTTNEVILCRMTTTVTQDRDHNEHCMTSNTNTQNKTL